MIFRYFIFSLSLANRVFPLPRLSSSPASLIVSKSTYSAGISTCCPSDTPFGLSLGPDLPWADEPSPGNLRLSTARILTLLSLLIPAFSLLLRPHILSIMLHPTTECSSTTYLCLTIPIIPFSCLAFFHFVWKYYIFPKENFLICIVKHRQIRNFGV